MTKFELAEKKAEAFATRALWRKAIAGYETAMKAVETAKAKVELLEQEYLAVERYAAA